MKQYGFIPDTIAPEDYVFGASVVSGEIIKEDGQWDSDLPLFELQSKGKLETMNCTSFGTLNALETLFQAKYGVSVNYSDRYIGIMAETTPNGNSPHKVAETIRKVSGVINEADLPFSKDIEWDWQKYYSPKPIPKYLRKKGDEWLDTWVFKHEWVNNDPTSLMEALKRSPLGVAVYAWNKEGDVYTKRGPANHWCMLYGFKEGEYWRVYDHYDENKKKLAWDYDFELVKRYYIDSKPKTRDNWVIDLLKRVGLFLKEIVT